MKIAMIGQKGIPAHYGGVERHVHDLAVRLATDHDVTVYSRAWYTPEKQSAYKGIRIVHTPTLHTKHLDAITHTFTSTMHALFQKYDVIHYHGVGPALVSWIPRIFAPGTKVIITFHTIDRYQTKWNLFARTMLRLGEWAACTFAHKTIVISETLRQYCRNEFNCDTVYIPNGVEIKDVPKYDKLAQFGLTKNNYIVMISRLIPDKGAHILVEAFLNIKKQYPENLYIQNLKLAIVGGAAYVDDYIKELHTQAAIINDIVFTDFQTDDTLEQLYAHSIVLVNPSFAEGLPLTVLQAMSYERPVLLSTIPGHTELLDDIRIFFKTNDVSSLTKCLDSFLSMSIQEKKDIAKNNKCIIQQKYTWDSIVPQITNVYDKTCKPYIKKNQY